MLVTFDVATNLAFSIPAGARQPTGSLERFFNYGESIEAKLDRSVGKSGMEAAAIVRSGWVSTELYLPPDDWDDGGTRVAVYGMSFARRIAIAMDGIEPSLAIIRRAGPGAPLNHSFALFEADPFRAEVDHVVIGILSSSIPYLPAMSGLGYTVESPAPYSFPKFTLNDGELERFDPVITERDVFIDAFRNRSDLWEAHRESLGRHDPYWDPFVFDHSGLDASALVKLLRLAWSKRTLNQLRSAVYSSSDGYATEHPAIAAVPAMLESIHKTCLEGGQRLTIILLHSRGEPGHLDAWLHEDLEERGINVVSTIDWFSSLDVSNFEGDGHYLPERDLELATAVIAGFND